MEQQNCVFFKIPFLVLLDLNYGYLSAAAMVDYLAVPLESRNDEADENGAMFSNGGRRDW